MNLKELLGDPAWLFDLGFPIRSLARRITNPERLEWRLNDEHAIPPLSSLSNGLGFAKTYLAWTGTGLYFQSRLKPPSGKLSVTESSKHLARTSHISLYIDTRWSPGVHRATSYCHRFDFIINRPSSSEPIQRGHGELNQIQRARAAPTDVHPSQISVGSFLEPDGIEIRAFLKGETLTGYAPDEHQEIGVFFTINDSLLGNQILARTLQSPYFEDPSLWCRAKLIPFQTDA